METIIDGEVCVDTSELAKILGVRKQTLSSYALYKGMPCHKNKQGYKFPVERCKAWFMGWKFKTGKYDGSAKLGEGKTLCWSCQRPLMGKDACSWHKEAKPVDGWIAKETDISFNVRYCPEFVPDRDFRGIRI